MADDPQPLSEVESRIHRLPGTGWLLAHTLGPDERVGQELSVMVFLAEGTDAEPLENKRAVHRRMIGLLYEVFGNPFCPVRAEPRWLTPEVVALAQAAYQEKAFGRL